MFQVHFKDLKKRKQKDTFNARLDLSTMYEATSKNML